jgi:PAS domain S-box-containing protein
VGHPLIDIFDVGSSAEIHLQCKRVLETEQSELLDGYLTLNGVRRAFSIATSLYRGNDGEVIGVIGIARDVTLERSAELSLRLQSEILEMIAVATPVHRVLKKIASGIQSNVSIFSCDFFLYDENTDRFQFVASAGVHSQLGAVFCESELNRQTSPVASAVRHGTDVFTDQLARVEPPNPFSVVAIENGVDSLFAYPIRSDKAEVRQTLGVLAVYSSVPTTLDPTSIRFIEIMRRLASISMENERTQQELRSKEARFRHFVDNTTDAFFLLDEKSNVVDVSNRACEHLGYVREELIGARPELYNSVVNVDQNQTLLEQLDDGGRLAFESIHTRKDGTQVPVDVRLVNFVQDSKRFTIGTVRDISEQRLAEVRLRNSLKQLSSIYNAACDVLFLLSVSANETYLFESINPAFTTNTGLKEGDVIGKRLEQIVPDPTAQAIFDQIRIAIAGKHVVRWEERTPFPSGLRFGEVSVSPVFDDEGNCTHIVGSVHDVTDRKRAETETLAHKDRLRESEKRLAEAQRIARIGSWIWDPVTDKVSWSDMVCELFGIDPATAQPSFESFLALVHPDDRHIAIDRVCRMRAGDSEFANDLRLIRPDGECIWIHSRARATRDSRGKILQVEGTDQDITERKRSENAIRESEERLKVALQAASAVAFVWDAKKDEVTRYYSVEPSLPVNPHHPEKSADVRLKVHPDDRAVFDANIKACLASGSEYRSLYRVVRPDGSIGWLEEWGHLDRDSDNQPNRLIGISIDVTERKRAEGQLRRTSNLLEAVVSSANDAIFVKDQQGKYLLFNQAAARYVGKATHDVLGLNDSQLFDETSSQKIRQSDLQVMSTGTNALFEEILTADGITRIFQSTKGPYRDEFGNVVGVLGISRDVTSQKESQRKLELTQFSVDHVTDSILWVNSEGDFVNVNGAACRRLGYTREELIGKNVADISLNTSAYTWAGIWETVKTQSFLSAITKHVTKDGSILDMELTANYLRYEDNEIICVIARDITRKVRAEKRIATQHAVVSILSQANDLSEAAPELLETICQTAAWDCGEIWLPDLDQRFITRVGMWCKDTMASNCFCADSPSPRFEYGHDLIGRVWKSAKQEWIPDVGTLGESKRIQDLHDASIKSMFAFPIMLNDQILGVASFLSQHENEPDVAVCQMCESIGIQIGQFLQRHETEFRLRLFRSLIDQATDFIEVIDPETGRILDVNLRCCAAHGYSRDEYLNLHVSQIGETVSRFNAIDSVIEELRRKGSVMLESKRRRKDGSVFPVEVNANLIRLEREYIVTIVRDITGRLQMEENMRQSHKMEAVGQLAGGVAHDFNNLLTVINCHTEMLLLKAATKDSNREHYLSIQHAGQRAADLTAQLLAFSRKTFIEPRIVNLNVIVEAANRLLSRLIREDISLELHLDPSLCHIKADPGQVEQVLVNLVVNARDAMPHGGNLKIKTCNLVEYPSQGNSHDHEHGEMYACLEVSDTGLGMSDSVKSRIFEPFFTTKELGKGTGLGLAVVHGLMAQCGGHVRVTSTIGVGTTFLLMFPVTQATGSATAGIALNESEHVGGCETILVVEDDISVREIVRNVLESQGFQVLVAETGVKALQLMQAGSQEIHLVVSDVVMPEMGGKQLAQEIRARRPGLHTLFMSGYTDDTGADLGLGESGDEFLQKPFTPASLVQKVRSILDREPRTRR